MFYLNGRTDLFSLFHQFVDLASTSNVGAYIGLFFNINLLPMALSSALSVDEDITSSFRSIVGPRPNSQRVSFGSSKVHLARMRYCASFLLFSIFFGFGCVALVAACNTAFFNRLILSVDLIFSASLINSSILLERRT